MLKKSEVDKEEELLREEIRELSDEDRKDFYSNVKEKVKDPDTYAVLNWFFIAGLHHFYLGKLINGSINLLVFIIGLIMILIEEYQIGFGLIIAIFIIELWALFNSQIIVQDKNNKIYKAILDKIKSRNINRENL